MVQELLALVPRVGTVALIAASVGSLAGAGLWLAGARFSRSLITLLLVTAGAAVGLQLPRWFGWRIDGWAPAMGVAALLGVSGFLLHRFWVGVGLGLILAAWAALVSWAICHGDKLPAWPAWEQGMTLLAYLRNYWEALPIDMCRLLPFVCGAAMVTGLSIAILWPRLGLVLLYSATGVSLLATLGLEAVSLGQPAWIRMLPASTSSQGLILLGMTAFGATLQWYLTPVMVANVPESNNQKPAAKES